MQRRRKTILLGVLAVMAAAAALTAAGLRSSLATRGALQDKELCSIAETSSQSVAFYLVSIEMARSHWASMIELGASVQRVSADLERSRQATASGRAEVANEIRGLQERLSRLPDRPGRSREARAILVRYLGMLQELQSQDAEPTGSLATFSARLSELRSQRTQLEGQFKSYFPSTRFCSEGEFR